jgi:hypothetical protein
LWCKSNHIQQGGTLECPLNDNLINLQPYLIPWPHFKVNNGTFQNVKIWSTPMPMAMTDRPTVIDVRRHRPTHAGPVPCMCDSRQCMHV